MSTPTTLERWLAITTGAVILAVIADTTIAASGGYNGPHARLIMALTLGVFAGACLIGRAWKMSRPMALAIVLGLVCGEAYGLIQTAETIVTGREDAQAPARAKTQAHDDAAQALDAAKTAPVTSLRIDLALAAQRRADADVSAEAQTGCKRICQDKKAIANAAAADVQAAISEAETTKAASIDSAQRVLDAHPLPASGTALADRLHVPGWVIDLIVAALRSLAANGLAATLIAFGAHGRTSSHPTLVAALDMQPLVPRITVQDAPDSSPALMQVIDDDGQSGYSVRSSELELVRAAFTGQLPDRPVFLSQGPASLVGARCSDKVIAFPGPDNSPNGSPNGPKPGKRAAARKAEVMADIVSRISSGERFASQEDLRAALSGRFGAISRSTLSDWLAELGRSVDRTQVGRCKAVG